MKTIDEMLHLELLTADVAGQKLIKSGLLQDVIGTPDPHTNSLLVTAPEM